MPSALKVFRLLRSYDVDLELGAERETLRVEIFAAERDARRFRVRLMRDALLHAVVGFDEQGEEVEVTPAQVLEDFSDLLDDTDLDFEADDVEAAAKRIFDALERRVNEAAWAKTSGTA